MATSTQDGLGKPLAGWQLRLYTIIFEAETRAGRLFDQWLIALILTSVLVVVVDSVQSPDSTHRSVFLWMEWLFTLAFTLEYVARLVCVRHPWRYVFSFYGVIDLLALLPTYLALLVPEMQALIDVRVLRLLRVFRVFKSVYWAITTMTTVGFGDITPKTDFGRLISSAMMLLGWGTLAVPTGIVTAEMTARRIAVAPTTRTCHECLTEGHLAEAKFCFHCGAELPNYLSDVSQEHPQTYQDRSHAE